MKFKNLYRNALSAKVLLPAIALSILFLFFEPFLTWHTTGKLGMTTAYVGLPFAYQKTHFGPFGPITTTEWPRLLIDGFLFFLLLTVIFSLLFQKFGRTKGKSPAYQSAPTFR